MTNYVNGLDLPISIAAWLAHDAYVPNHDIISATQLIRPTRQLILSYRLEQGIIPNVIAEPVDITQMLKSRKGTAVHEGIENVWKDPERRNKALLALGYPEKSLSRFKVNLDPDALTKNDIAVYTERFCEREHSSGYWIGGTADFVLRGRVQDFKNTSTFSYMDAAKDVKYQLQGSIYRWAMPEIITEDEMDIIEMYDDWSAAMTFKKDYPPSNIVIKPIPLLSIKATDKFIERKVIELIEFMEIPEPDLPYCSDEDLWRKNDVYKYFSKATNKKSSGNFDTYEEAMVAMRNNGGVGEVRTVKGKAVACRFCNARPICSQAKHLKAIGELDA